jgi:hypothetical protein
MKKVDRRSALKIGVAAASAAVVKPVAAQTTDALTGKETSPWPGVVVRACHPLGRDNSSKRTAARLRATDGLTQALLRAARAVRESSSTYGTPPIRAIAPNRAVR